MKKTRKEIRRRVEEVLTKNNVNVFADKGYIEELVILVKEMMVEDELRLIKKYNNQTDRVERILLSLSLENTFKMADPLVLDGVIKSLPNIVNLSMNGVTQEKLKSFKPGGELDAEGLKSFLFSLEPYRGYLNERGEGCTSSEAYWGYK